MSLRSLGTDARFILIPPQIAQESYRENHFNRDRFCTTKTKTGHARSRHFPEVALCYAVTRYPLPLGDSVP
jgi:hypothetical protein